MSQLNLSSLILHQNSVDIDQSYLQKCGKNDSKDDKDSLSISQNARVLSPKDIKINRNFLANRKKHSSPRSVSNFNNTLGKNKDPDSGEKLYKLGCRVEAFEENMRRLEARFGKQFFKLQEEITNKRAGSNSIFEDLKKIRVTLDDAKKNIQTVLNTMATKNPQP